MVRGRSHPDWPLITAHRHNLQPLVPNQWNLNDLEDISLLRFDCLVVVSNYVDEIEGRFLSEVLFFRNLVSGKEGGKIRLNDCAEGGVPAIHPDKRVSDS